MEVSIHFLLVLLLVSLSESRTGKTQRNLSDDEEFESIMEQAVLSESAEESDPRWTSEMTDGQVDLDDVNSFENWKTRRDLEEEASLPILKELDILRKRSGGQYTHHPRYDREGVARSKTNLHNLSRRTRRFHADNLMAVTLYHLSGTKTYVCDNSLEIYSRVLVNVDETAILYSPMFLQRREYPNNSNCGWKLETSDPHHLEFNCSVFDVREGDYLSLRDDESLELERFSGGRMLNHITKMNSTFVVFYSNDKETGRGFNCSVSSVRDSGSVDTRKVEVEPSGRSEIELASKQSLIAKLHEQISVKAELPAVERISPPVKFISEEILESGKTPNDFESRTHVDSVLNKSSVEKVDEGGSSVEDRLTYLKIETSSSSMHADVYSSKVMQTVVDAMGNISLVARTYVNSTRVVGITTNVVEKKQDGGGARFAERYVYDPTRSNLPGRTTTSVMESNMSSETSDKTEFVIDDLTGEKHQADSSFTKKASSESTEIKSSRISFPEEFVEPTPPM